MESQNQLTIITAVYNRVEMVSTAIESVLSQWTDGFEHLIIDGGSNDGTLDVLARYPHLRIVSEPDCGIYDAWNKGVRLASGNFITFLNSDDHWAPNVITDLLKCIKHPNDIIAAKAYTIQDESYKHVFVAKEYLPFTGNEYLKNMLNRGPAINSWIMPKPIIEQLNYFDTSYIYAADFDFALRLLLSGFKIKPHPVNFYIYQMHPGSATFSLNKSNEAVITAENINVIEKNISLQKGTLYQKAILIFQHFRLARRKFKMGKDNSGLSYIKLFFSEFFLFIKIIMVHSLSKGGKTPTSKTFGSSR